MAILITGHICLVFISPPGELTIIVYFMMVMGKLCLAKILDDMKECDAPESNKIVAGNIPNTQYHILGLLGFLGSHMVNLAIGEILLPL
jgi:hypothetical protein